VNEAAEWGTSEHLLATLVDELALSNYLLFLRILSRAAAAQASETAGGRE